MSQGIDVNNVALYGQTKNLDVALISVFGWNIGDMAGFIPDISERAINLLIEQYRKPYVD